MEGSISSVSHRFKGSLGVRVDCITEIDRYDAMLCGWVRAGGRYLWVELSKNSDVTDHDVKLRYDVFEIEDRSAKLSDLKRVRSFRHCVGWHCTYAPGEKRGARGSPKPGYASWYKHGSRKDQSWFAAWDASKLLVGHITEPILQIEMIQ